MSGCDRCDSQCKYDVLASNNKKTMAKKQRTTENDVLGLLFFFQPFGHKINCKTFLNLNRMKLDEQCEDHTELMTMSSGGC